MLLDSTYLQCMLHMATPFSFVTDAHVAVEETEYLVNEGDGYVEICTVMTTSCSVCPEPKGSVTLSITPESHTGATGNHKYEV